MITRVLVLGAGSAGLIAAISLKKKLPQLAVQIVRSKEIGIIGVGESTTPNVPAHLFNFMGINPGFFYAAVRPTWKLGIHFLWGPRKSFNYGFGFQLDQQWSDLPRPNGFYCDEDFSSSGLCMALMEAKKAVPRRPDGSVEIPGWHAFHVENAKLVACLEQVAREVGITFVEANVRGGDMGPEGISAVVLEDGRRLTADLYVDASGFRSVLLGKALEEPFIGFEKSLLCDRALMGGWARTDEPILPYTTAETMDAGWCWRIEHEDFVARGYVYSSAAISDDEARAEFVRKNPKAKPADRVVQFRSGRYERTWVKNVVAVGNACGFVEPLEASALMVLCWQTAVLVDVLQHTMLAPPPSVLKVYNKKVAESWEDIRNFLTLHYWGNTLLDTPFWRHAREDSDIEGLRPLLEFYDENGPTGICRYAMSQGEGSAFGIEGYLVMLVGLSVPYRARHKPTPAEWETWRRHQADTRREAARGFTSDEMVQLIRQGVWRWQ